MRVIIYMYYMCHYPHLTMSPKRTRRFCLITRFILIFSVATLSSDNTIQTYNH